MRNCNCCLQISVGRFLPCGVCGKQIHCFCIFITDIIFVEKGKGVCMVKNMKLLDLHMIQLTCSVSPVQCSPRHDRNFSQDQLISLQLQVEIKLTLAVSSQT